MSDPTNTSLELAFLDQRVEGMFRGRRHCYVAVIADKGWGLGVAVADEQGYNPIDGLSYPTKQEADAVVAGMNEHIGVSRTEATEITVTTMRRAVRS